MADRVTEMHAEICKTLGSPTRIQILMTLHEGERTVGQVSRALGLREANVSQHLAVLRHRGLVVPRREGTSVFYKISSPKIIEACGLLREVLMEQLKDSRKLAASGPRTK